MTPNQHTAVWGQGHDRGVLGPRHRILRLFCVPSPSDGFNHEHWRIPCRCCPPGSLLQLVLAPLHVGLLRPRCAVSRRARPALPVRFGRTRRIPHLFGVPCASDSCKLVNRWNRRGLAKDVRGALPGAPRTGRCAAMRCSCGACVVLPACHKSCTYTVPSHCSCLGPAVSFGWLRGTTPSKGGGDNDFNYEFHTLLIQTFAHG